MINHTIHTYTIVSKPHITLTVPMPFLSYFIKLKTFVVNDSRLGKVIKKNLFIFFK